MRFDLTLLYKIKCCWLTEPELSCILLFVLELKVFPQTRASPEESVQDSSKLLSSVALCSVALQPPESQPSLARSQSLLLSFPPASRPVLRKSLTCLGRIQIQVYLPEIFDGSASYMGMHQRGAPIIAVEVTTWICHMCDILDIQYIDVSPYTKSPDVQLQCLQLRFQTNKFKIQTKSGPIFSKIWTKSGPFASRIRTQ